MSPAFADLAPADFVSITFAIDVPRDELNSPDTEAAIETIGDEVRDGAQAIVERLREKHPDYRIDWEGP